MKRLVLVLAIAAVLIPCASHAQFQPNSWLVVGNATWNIATIKNFGSTINGLGFGVSAERILGGNGAISIGLMANYVNVDGTVSEQVQGPSGPEPLQFTAEAKGIPVALYSRYMFGGPGIRGFVGLGPGFFAGETTVQEVGEPAMSESATKFAGMGMAGAFFRLSPKVWLNASVTLFLVPDTEIFTDNTWAGSLGLAFPIGNP
jgi:hypothetical protein